LGIGKVYFDYSEFFIGYRVPAGLLFFLILNQIPTLLMDVIPFATLLGVVLALGRLLRERELDVIRLSGARLSLIIRPIYIRVFIICVLAFFWNDYIVPSANHRFQQEIRRLSMQEDLPLLREHVVIKAPNNRFIYLDRVEHQQRRIRGVLIIEIGDTGRWARLISAEYGTLKRGVWELHQGTIHQFAPDGSIAWEQRYRQMSIQMANDFVNLFGQEKTPAEMSTGELLRYIGLYKRSGLNTPAFNVFYHLKFADPLISLVLVFLAAPLAVMTGRNSRWLGFVICILAILAYYTMQVVGRTMGANGLIPPWSAAWLPHFIFIAIGTGMLLRSEQLR
jgi:lipopolysaccharide export system permease protein